MYATTARRSRPVPFSTRPGIAERLGIPYMDPLLLLAACAGVNGCKIFNPPATLTRKPPAENFRQRLGTVRGD